MIILNEYTLLCELGSGGFAKVYKVRHNELGYIRAIRVLNEPVMDENSRTYQKFLRECKVLLRLGNGNHRNIVHIYQPRLLDNHALVEMDYVDGMDIAHYLNENGNFLPVEEVLRMAVEISGALAYCHEDIYKFCMDPTEDHLESDPVDGSKWIVNEETKKRLIEKYKVIHNDIHSGNIMRREDGSFVLLDFGLAITGDDDVRNSSRHENGAIEFKAPEKWDDDSVLTEQSDIYSFGVVMYEYLAGRVPFVCEGNSFNARKKLYEKIKNSTSLPSIKELRESYFLEKHKGGSYEKDYPDWLEKIIQKCLEKDPAKRFRNGKELHNTLIQHIEEAKLADAKAKTEALNNEIMALNDRIEALQEELERTKAEQETNRQPTESNLEETPPPTQNTQSELQLDEGRYVGEVANNKPHGKGIIYFKSEDPHNRVLYKGNWINGSKTGMGFMISKEGDMYEGQFKNGQPNGQGTLYFRGGRYEGDWKDGRRNGHGIYYYTNGDRYEGDWNDGNRHGQGTYYFNNGNRYEGSWKDDMMDGPGIFYYAHGDRYEGSWKDGKRHDEGTYYWSDGTRDTGSYNNDEMDGVWIRIKNDGTTLRARYRRGIMVRDWHHSLF